jgi:predicted amidohydrolase
MIVVAAQVEPSSDPAQNLAKGRDIIAQVAARGAQLVVFPELFMAWQASYTDPDATRALAQPLAGPFVQGLAEAARTAGIWVIAGMLETPSTDEQRAYNTTIVLDNQGRLAATYHKTHLFDAFGQQESRSFAPGDRLFQPIPTPFGCLGLFVCYELRFPEVARYQAERGAEVLVVPSAWVAGPMKERHWRSLAIARAIENGCYVIAAGQAGHQYLGRSLFVDPMGVVLAEGTEKESLVYGEIERERVAAVRSTVPSLQQRRVELYEREHQP